MFGERSFIMFVSIMIASLIVAPQPFDVENLGCISDGQCFSQAMNESGQVAGYGDAPNGMGQHGFVWNGNEMVHIVPLNYPNGGNCWAYGINDFGDVVGYSSNGGLSIHAFLWDGGQMNDLGVPEWATVDFSRAQDVNNNGWVVGMAGGVPYDLRGFIKHGDIWDEIPTFGGNESRAYAINDLNDVVGWTRNEDGKFRAFAIPNGNVKLMADIGDLGGGAAEAFGVNNNRVIVGQSKVDDTYFHAFAWMQNNGMVDLGTLGGNESYAWAISESGIVVGKSQIPEGGTHGFIFEDGVMYDVNDFIVPDLDITIVNIRDINSLGQLAAVAEFSDGTKGPCLLTPMGGTIPEDVNGDGNVDVVDLLAVVGAWGPCKSCNEDINGDSTVDVVDLLAVISAWSI
jgi:probable HAF family extracellular repeat protein|tara:strand:+ start:123 stop:1319 length:1197 start_codon:yes stop_codon:yes gene_type:complete